MKSKISTHESQKVEYKEQWRDDILKTVCAFANTNGGVVYVGVDDNGQSVAVKDIKKLLEDIPNKIRDVLGIVADVAVVKKAGKQVIKIFIAKYNAPISYHGVFYARSGSTTIELKGAALSRYLLSCSGTTWDSVVESRASLKDIDAASVRQFQQSAKKRFPFIARERNARMVLEKLNLMENGKLKRAAILLFAKDPRKYFTAAFVQVGRFVSESEVVSTDIIEGNLFAQVEKTIEVLRIKYLENRFYYEGLRRKEDMIYPEDALREAVINAVIHRDYMGPHTQLRVYNDKLWLVNAGTLPDKLTFEKLKKQHLSCPRNELLADIFFKAGYIEAWGRGTVKIINACLKAGLPAPEFSDLTGGFLISFSKAEAHSPEQGLIETVEKSAEKVRSKYGVNTEKVWTAIGENLFIRTHEIANKTNLAQRTVEKAIAILKKKGLLRRVGPDKGGHWEIMN